MKKTAMVRTFQRVNRAAMRLCEAGKLQRGIIGTAWSIVSVCALAVGLGCATGRSRADDMDGWCAQVKKASSIVICSDLHLREQAIARNKLFEMARIKLNPTAYKELAEDQSRWIKSYTAACEVAVDDPPPSLPIPQTVINCYRRASDARTAYLAAYLSAPNPMRAVPPVASGNERREEIALVENGGVYRLPVLINGVLPLQFLLDSGATDVSLPEDVFSVLKRTGTLTSEDYIGTESYQLADGSIVQSDRFYIRELQVGTSVLNHVSASIGDKRAPLLLGQSFLKRFASVEIDNTRHVLILKAEQPDADASATVQPPAAGFTALPPISQPNPYAVPSPQIDLSKIKLSDIERPFNLINPEIVQFIISNAGDRRISEITIGNATMPGRCSPALSDYQGFKKFLVDLAPGDSVELQGEFAPAAQWFCIISAGAQSDNQG